MLVWVPFLFVPSRQAERVEGPEVAGSSPVDVARVVELAKQRGGRTEGEGAVRDPDGSTLEVLHRRVHVELVARNLGGDQRGRTSVTPSATSQRWLSRPLTGCSV